MTTFEQKKDYTADLEILTDSISNSKDDNLEETIANLFSLEKKCRLGTDHVTHKNVCLLIVKTCKQKNDWAKLNSSLILINKRNIQGKVTVSAVVEEAMKYIDLTPSIDVKIELMNTLKEICDGKIYVEKESAQLHFLLSKIYEDQGDVAKACDTIQDVHVETYGSLSKIEKGRYILEQIRLNLLRKDYVRAAIHSSKMNRKTLEEKDFAEIKLVFYTYQIEYFLVEKNAWEICQAYYKIASLLLPPASTPPVTEDDKTKKSKETVKEKKEKDSEMVVEESKEPVGVSLGVKEDVLESTVIFLLLSKFDNHQSDMMHRLKKQLGAEFKAVQLNEVYAYVLRLFTTDEIIPPVFPGQDLIEAHASLSKIANFETDSRAHFVQQLHDRVVEHNLRVVAKYYKRIHSKRLSEIMSVSVAQLEVYLSDISGRGDMAVKIDRPAGIVSFAERQAPESVLSDWASDMSKLMQLMEGTCHLINRENMVHKI